MKKITHKISLLLSIGVLLISIYAQSTITLAQSSTGTQKQQETEKALETLFYGTNIDNAPELEAIPDEIGGDILTDIIPGIIKLALQLGGVAAFAVAMYAGIQMIGSSGSEDGTKKGKDTLVYAIVGIIIISVAYAVVTGIINFRF